MLSHDNVTWTSRICMEHYHWQQGHEVLLSYLPLRYFAKVMQPSQFKYVTFFRSFVLANDKPSLINRSLDGGTYKNILFQNAKSGHPDPARSPKAL